MADPKRVSFAGDVAAPATPPKRPPHPDTGRPLRKTPRPDDEPGRIQTIDTRSPHAPTSTFRADGNESDENDFGSLARKTDDDVLRHSPRSGGEIAFHLHHPHHADHNHFRPGGDSFGTALVERGAQEHERMSNIFSRLTSITGDNPPRQPPALSALPGARAAIPVFHEKRHYGRLGTVNLMRTLSKTAEPLRAQNRLRLSDLKHAKLRDVDIIPAKHSRSPTKRVMSSPVRLSARSLSASHRSVRLDSVDPAASHRRTGFEVAHGSPPRRRPTHEPHAFAFRDGVEGGTSLFGDGRRAPVPTPDVAGGEVDVVAYSSTIASLPQAPTLDRTGSGGRRSPPRVGSRAANKHHINVSEYASSGHGLGGGGGGGSGGGTSRLRAQVNAQYARNLPSDPVGGTVEALRPADPFRVPRASWRLKGTHIEARPADSVAAFAPLAQPARGQRQSSGSGRGGGAAVGIGSRSAPAARPAPPPTSLRTSTQRGGAAPRQQQQQQQQQQQGINGTLHVAPTVQARSDPAANGTLGRMEELQRSLAARDTARASGSPSQRAYSQRTTDLRNSLVGGPIASTAATAASGDDDHDHAASLRRSGRRRVAMPDSIDGTMPPLAKHDGEAGWGQTGAAAAGNGDGTLRGLPLSSAASSEELSVFADLLSSEKAELLSFLADFRDHEHGRWREHHKALAHARSQRRMVIQELLAQSRDVDADLLADLENHVSDTDTHTYNPTYTTPLLAESSAELDGVATDEAIAFLEQRQRRLILELESLG